MAVRGPFESVTNIQGIYRRKRVWRQDKPFTAPLPFDHVYYNGKVSDLIGNTTSYQTNLGHRLWYLTTQGSEVYRTDTSDYRNAYDSFIRKITRESGKASGGVTLAESSSSLNMISNRATQLVTAMNAIRKRDFGLLTKSLNLSRDDHRARTVWKRQDSKSVVRDGASNLLEYTFGWVPMVNDMRAACNVLSSTQKPLFIKGGGSRSETDQWNNPLTYGSWGYADNGTVQVSVKRLIGGYVTISNPNVDLANRLGLVNPIHLAWQVIPYSFLVDQFIPIGRYLESYSDMFGRTYGGGFQSVKVEATSIIVEREISVAGPLVRHETWVEEGKGFQRILMPSLPVPTDLPSFKLPVSNLLGRAITSVALLLQRLR